jgi:hypothetical protein
MFNHQFRTASIQSHALCSHTNSTRLCRATGETSSHISRTTLPSLCHFSQPSSPTSSYNRCRTTYTHLYSPQPTSCSFADAYFENPQPTSCSFADACVEKFRHTLCSFMNAYFENPQPISCSFADACFEKSQPTSCSFVSPHSQKLHTTLCSFVYIYSSPFSKLHPFCIAPPKISVALTIPSSIPTYPRPPPFYLLIQAKID